LFAEKAGYKLPYLNDFRAPGVTSITCDTHKFALGPKGYSTLLFRTKKLRSYQFFTSMNWQGGLYATTAIAGSRPGATVAGTWATMVKHGHN
jgi:sphinganine-1-phosphate aldolase